jgi:hypothetical protein
MSLRPLPAQEVSGDGPVGSPHALAQHLLREAEQLRRVAAASNDAVIGDELMDLVGRCAAAAAALLSHAGGHADKATSHLVDRWVPRFS